MTTKAQEGTQKGEAMTGIALPPAPKPCETDELTAIAQREWDGVLSNAIDLYNRDRTFRGIAPPIEQTVGDTFERNGEIVTNVSLEFNGMPDDPAELADRLEKLAKLIRGVNNGNLQPLPGDAPDIDPNGSC